MSTAARKSLQVSNDDRPPDSSAPRTAEETRSESEPPLGVEDWAILSSQDLTGSRHLGQLRREAYRYTRNHHDSQDVVSDALVKTAYWLVEVGRRDIPVVRKYLWEAVRTTAIDRARHQTVVDRVFPPKDALEAQKSCDIYPDKEPAPHESVRFAAEDRMLQKILMALPEKSRHVLLLRLVWGLDAREIAEICNISKRTAEKHLEIARKKIEQRSPAAGGPHGIP
jgi:RNA polymerase sigma factor (sigma-70 family)